MMKVLISLILGKEATPPLLLGAIFDRISDGLRLGVSEVMDWRERMAEERSTYLAEAVISEVNTEHELLSP